MSRKDKIFLAVVFGAYTMAWIINLKYIPPVGEAFKTLGHRWVVSLGSFSFNPVTIINASIVFLVILWFALSVRDLKLIPDRKQSILEWLFNTFYEMVEDTVPDPKFVRPTFVIAMTVFIFVWTSNMLASFPGVVFVGWENGKLTEIGLFTDTWQAPTADLNTNLTYALMVFVISHAFAIKAKGFKAWLKSWFEPNAIMMPMNLIGELAKPISHSLRLFGNIAGGAILTYIFTYMIKYFLLPVFLWGFFGIFVGTIQALVFSILVIAYISAQLT